MPAKWQQWMPLYIDRLRGSLSVQVMSGDAFKGYVYPLMAALETLENAAFYLAQQFTARQSFKDRMRLLPEEAEALAILEERRREAQRGNQ